MAIENETLKKEKESKEVKTKKTNNSKKEVNDVVEENKEEAKVVAKKETKKEKKPFSLKVKEIFKAIGKFFKRLGFKIAGFFVRTSHELRRMRWPSKKTLITATCIVLAFTFLFGLYIVFDDLIIGFIFKYIY